ncbi:MAG: hypothetical protein ABIU09_13090 [Pyrinomonadaceae bacterium]
MSNTVKWKTAAVVLFATTSLVITGVVSAKHFGTWSDPVSMEFTTPGASSDFNTAYNDGCPIQAPDGLSFYMASNRPGGLGGQDIWVARRENYGDPWGAPVNLGAPVNSAFDDFCPTPVLGQGLFFVTARPSGTSRVSTSCGGADIHFTRLGRDGWEEPRNLGCHINSSAGEASPSYFEDDAGNSILYFSSNRTGGFEPGGSDSDIYYSVNFGPAQLAPGINTAQNDFRPNVRKDGREIVFDSDRPMGLGGFDIWTSLRSSSSDEWPAAANVLTVNTSANETRPSLSWDGEQLVFGSNRFGVEGPAPGTTNLQADIFVSIRPRIRGSR